MSTEAIQMDTGGQDVAPEGHDDKMAAAMDNAGQPPADPNPDANPAAPQKPEGLPDKFWDAEAGVVRTDDLVKSYSELEKKSSQAKPATDDQAATDDAAATDDTPKEGGEVEPVPFTDMYNQFKTYGELSAENYESLAKMGISKNDADAFIAGQQALEAQYMSMAHESAGGKEHYEAAIAWAAAELSQAEQDAYDKVISEGSDEDVKQAIRGMVQRHQEAEGKAPDLVDGDGGDVTGGVYESWAQVQVDMRKPEYKNDPAFRAVVEAKLDRSKI